MEKEKGCKESVHSHALDLFDLYLVAQPPAYDRQHRDGFGLQGPVGGIGA